MISRILPRLFGFNLENPDDRNGWYLVVEIFWASMLASAASFNAALAIRLGATNKQVSLLTSMPALLAVLVSIPSGRFLQARTRRKPWLLYSLTVYRSGFVLVALLPWLHLPQDYAGLVLIIWLVVNTATAHFFNVGFIPMLSDVVPERNRAGVFAGRNIIYNIALSVFGVLFGWCLDRIIYPINYTLMYLFGFVCSMISVYYLIKVRVPDSVPAQGTKAAQRLSLRNWFLARWKDLSASRGFLQITVNTLLHGVGLWAIAPLYVLYFVRTLGATEGWLGLNATVASISTIFGFTLWRRLMERWGESVTIKRTIVMVGLYPVLVSLLPSLTLILIATGLNGLLVPGVNLSHFNTLLKVTPEHNRPGYTAAYVTIMNIGAFICPFIGVALADRFGFIPTLLGCGLLSVVGSMSFRFWPVQA